MEIDKIYNGDCLELMKDIQSGSVDMILCDLPFGTTRNQWDAIIPINKLWEQYKRICKPNAAIVLFSQQPFTSILVASNLDMFKYEWIWIKDNGTGHLNAKKMPMKIHENILVFYQQLPTYNPQMRIGFKPYNCKTGGASSNYGIYDKVTTISNGERYPTDVLYFTRDKEKLHPTAKPVNLLRYLIKTYTNENDLILDNCCGAGSTCVAAIKENRRFIGMELDKQYYNIATERIKSEQQQLSLF